MKNEKLSAKENILPSFHISRCGTHIEPQISYLDHQGTIEHLFHIGRYGTRTFIFHFSFQSWAERA